MCDNQNLVHQSHLWLSIGPKILRVLCTGLQVGLIGLVGIAGADEAAQLYRIPKQSLDSGLLRLAADSGLEILFTADKVRGITGNNLDGSMTPAQALSRLLQGSGMSYRFVDAKTVTVEQPDANFRKTANVDEKPESQSGGDATLPKVTVEADADPYDPYNTADPYNKSYSVTNSTTATKTDTPIMDTPVSIQVVPKAVLRDQQAWRVEDAVKNVSGVQQTWASGGQYQDFVIRGFGSGINYTRFRNGIRLTEGTFDMANVEQIEVLKGPAAMLYGRVEPGGMVNVVTKKPLDTPYYSLQQQFGSYDFFRTTVDATGPITTDKSLTYRFNLGYTDRDSFRDFIGEDRVFVAPSLHWQATPATQFNLAIEYSNNDTAYDNGIPAIGKRVVDVPINRNYTHPDFNRDNIENTLVDFNWSHNFNDAWKVSNGIVATMSNLQTRTIPVAYVQTQLEDTPNPQVRRGTYFEDFERDNYTTYLNLNGKFDTFGIKHNVLLGGDYYSREEKNSGFFGLNYAIQHNFADADALKYFTFIDLKNPDYNQFPFTFSELDNLRRNAPNDFVRASQSWYGLYFQDQLSFFDDKLQILGGGRYDWARQKQGSSFTSFADISGTAQNEEHFSPRVGILYRPINWLSVYGNYTESFGLNNGRTANNIPLAPEISEQFEAGLKTEWFDGRLTTSLAYFHITKDNILKQTGDVTFETVGAARSQGIEFDLAGQVTDELSVIATYAYTDARITKDRGLIFDDNGVVIGSNNGNQGNRLPTVAEHSGSTWLKYAFQNNNLKGLSLGVGAYLASSREGDNENSYQLPGYVRADAFAGYSFNIGKTKLTTQLNVTNVFDKRYYFAGQPYNTSKAYNMIADPLTFLGSVRLEY
ncbi:MAG: TonB-dependent receptor [Methyloglobulus sp.]|nr:TonB-dependent receptor [Methyloglobulus sp.]